MNETYTVPLKTALGACTYHFTFGNIEQASLANGWANSIVSAFESGTPPPPPPPELQIP